METTINSEYIHEFLQEKAYIAKLSLIKGSSKIARDFLPRKNIKRKAYRFDYQWSILKGGVFEKREKHHYQGEITIYFVVNYNGDIVQLKNKKTALVLLKKGIRSWGRHSPLKIQMQNLRLSKA